MIITITLLVLITLGFIGYKSDWFNMEEKNRDTSIVVRDFLDMMIPHHEEAVNISRPIMNDLSITEPKVRILAANIVDTQTFEMEKMRNIYIEFLGGSYTSTTTHSMDDTKDLKGDDLAKAYVENMIKHHKDAIKVAEKYIKLIDKIRKESSTESNGLIITNSHPSIDMTYDIAKGIIQDQKTEIEVMEGLY